MDAPTFWADPTVGNVIGIVSLAITLIGFIVSIHKIAQSKRAAEAAKDAANDARSRIVRLDAVAELASAIATIDEIKRLHRDEAWSVLPDRYSALKKCLIQIRMTEPVPKPTEQTLLQGAITQIASIERLVERALSTKGPLDTPKINGILSRQLESLTEIQTQIRNEMQA